MLQIVLPLVGIALCAWALVQFLGWTRFTLVQATQFQTPIFGRYSRSNKIERRQQNQVRDIESENTWKGFRMFRVAKLEKETVNATSVYLIPCDSKPIVSFKPGQHLTLQLQTGEESSTVTRCYSLSSAPDKNAYRITVKKVAPPIDQPGLPPGQASNYVNNQLEAGTTIPVKAPSGSFFLDDKDSHPVILLAAGVGITPMMSMIETAIAKKSNRGMLLFYGNLDGDNHIFKQRLDEISATYSNIKTINCYSAPTENDKPNHDYQQQGWVTTELIQRVLPSNKFSFYMCGPPAFMDSLYTGLTEWGVSDSNIHFEAFGPASIKRVSQCKVGEDEASVESFQVKFTESDCNARWQGDYESLLELAEANEIPMDSGCRAGSCGTCETALLKGTVHYPGDNPASCDKGRCLPCIAIPSSDIELEA